MTFVLMLVYLPLVKVYIHPWPYSSGFLVNPEQGFPKKIFLQKETVLSSHESCDKTQNYLSRS